MQEVKLNLNPTVPSIPRQKDKTRVDARYVVIDPYVSIHVVWDPHKQEVVYNVEEPLLDKESQEILGKVKNAMREMININVLSAEKTTDSLMDYVNKTARLVISELGFSVEEEKYKKMIYYLYRDFIGLNEIEAMMKDYYIEDIECNGVNEPLYVVHRVFRNIKTNVRFTSLDELSNFVEKLAQKTGRHISYASPILDGSLPDGSRVNATYTKDVTSKGPTFTIRKFTKTPWTPIQLIGFHSISPEMLAYFWLAVQYQSNIMIVGGTASGKTTLLNAMAFFIPQENRVVSIEDTRELNLPRENWLPSVVRSGVTGREGGVGDVDMFSLLKGSFRQNPDYVVVGEVRGKEASVLFQGMGSGHASISTMHADSVDSVVRRLESPPINLSPILVNGLDIVAIMTHAIVGGNEARRLREISEVVEVHSDGTVAINTPFKWDPAKDSFFFSTKNKVFEKITQKYGISETELQKEFQTRTKLLYEMYRQKVVGYEEVQQVINEYQKNPLAVLKRFGISSNTPFSTSSNTSKVTATKPLSPFRSRKHNLLS